jgi:hypothetical protein
MVKFTSEACTVDSRRLASYCSFGGGMMKEFECTICKKKWYSAATTTKPCEVCGGILVETALPLTRVVRHFTLITNEKQVSGSKTEEN